MDWYFGCAVDDLVVPCNQEMLDMFPSPNDWSQWEQSSSDIEPMSKYFVTPPNFTDSGLNFNGKCQNNVGMDVFDDEHSNNSNICDEYEGSVNEDISPWDVIDYQLDDIDTTNRTTDVFMNSSHDMSADYSTESFNFYDTEFENNENGVLPSECLFENMNVESECDLSHSFGMGSSKYLKTHDFSPPMGGGARLYTPVKAQYEENSLSPQFEVIDEKIEETRSQASVLQELENVMSQMSDQTRICFRDALYRLAESSGQQSIDLVLESRASSMASDGKSRSKNTKKTEAETNTIDRAVANLMFYKMDKDIQYLTNCHSSSSGDAEVPIFI